MKQNIQNSKQYQTVCPNCGLPISEWSGQGFANHAEIYCSEGCADGTGWVCPPRKEPKLEQFLAFSVKKPDE
jgi:hypothetical protein